MKKDKIDEFKSVISGVVILPSEAGYDAARAIWNGMFDRKPAVIARCTNTGDVVQAVNFGRDNNLLIAIKGGGRNSAGTASCDDGLMIDLSLMQEVDVNTDKNLFRRNQNISPE